MTTIYLVFRLAQQMSDAAETLDRAGFHTRTGDDGSGRGWTVVFEVEHESVAVAPEGGGQNTLKISIRIRGARPQDEPQRFQFTGVRGINVEGEDAAWI